jgi:hypothetical protein
MNEPRPRRRAGDSAVLASGLAGLREPLDGILGRVARLLAGPLSEDSRDQADAIHRDAASLLARFGGVRDLVEMEEGALEIRHVPFSPAVALRAEVDRLEPDAAAEGLDLSISVAPGTPARVLGDPSRIRQVLELLVRFAVDHTPRGSVEVRVAWLPGRLVVEVEDTGLGADEDRLRRFLASEPSRHELAFARELAEIMGGSLGATGRGGLGAAFRLELPLEEADSLDAPLPEAELDGARVMLLGDVDGDLEEVLETLAVRTSACGTSTEALRRLRAAAESGEPFDLVVATPPFDGPDALTFASLAKGDPRLARTGLVLVAPSGRPGDAAIHADAGWAGYLVQPVGAVTLSRMLRAILGVRQSCSGPRFVTRHTLLESGTGSAAVPVDTGGPSTEAGTG